MPDGGLPDGGLLRGFLNVQEGNGGLFAWVTRERSDRWDHGEELATWLAQFGDGAEITVMEKTTEGAA
jgi:hypothetical protein